MDNKPKEKVKFDFYNNYYWFFLGLFIPIIGVIIAYFFHNKYEKSTKSVLTGVFFGLAFFMIIGFWYGK